MEIANVLMVPDANCIENSVNLAKTYGCGFEYQDFFQPDLLDDEEALMERIALYETPLAKPQYSILHGAFLDVVVFSDDAKIREVSDFRVEQSLSIAKRLGAKAVVFHTNFTPNFHLERYEENWVERNAVYWTDKLLKYPELCIYMENMFDTDWTLLERLAKRMKEQERFGVCLDYAHVHVFGREGQMEAWVQALAPYVKYLHINDNDLQSDLHLALGEGRIDWNRFCSYYENYFKGAAVLIEVAGNDKAEQSLKVLQQLSVNA